jgi:hypothetical protein
MTELNKSAGRHSSDGKLDFFTVAIRGFALHECGNADKVQAMSRQSDCNISDAICIIGNTNKTVGSVRCFNGCG